MQSAKKKKKIKNRTKIDVSNFHYWKLNIIVVYRYTHFIGAYLFKQMAGE